MTTTLSTQGTRRAPLAVTTPVAVLLAMLVGGSTSTEQMSVDAPTRRPATTPPPVREVEVAAATTDRDVPEPVDEADDEPTRSTEDDDTALTWPADGKLTSEFGPRWGRMHKGIDIAADTGTPIVAAEDGRVVFSGWMSGYGQTIEIDHGDGMMTRYAHQSQTVASEGARVDRGQVIGRVGMTGSATGPHLHFEVRIDDKARDPEAQLRAIG
jgi:murein DD-endopeptidase MepM/ murein hydrolase activator NlpD